MRHRTSVVKIATRSSPNKRWRRSQQKKKHQWSKSLSLLRKTLEKQNKRWRKKSNRRLRKIRIIVGEAAF